MRVPLRPGLAEHGRIRCNANDWASRPRQSVNFLRLTAGRVPGFRWRRDRDERSCDWNPFLL